MKKEKEIISVKLTGGGTIGVLSLPAKLHKDSFNNCDLQALVPVSVQHSYSSLVKVYASGRSRDGSQVWTSNTHDIPLKKEISINNFDYRLYQTSLPEEFCKESGEVLLTFAYVDVKNDQTLNELFTSAPLKLFVSGEGYNASGVQISNYDAVAARVNLLSQLSIFKVDISQPLPLGAVFALNSFKTPFYKFYDKTGNIKYQLPLTHDQIAEKECSVMGIELVKDIETPGVIGYQTEYAFFDGGICQRTNKYNISQGNPENYVLLEQGSWQLVNHEYINEIKSQADQNSQDIEELYRITNTGITPIGEYPSQDTLPTDAELNAFVMGKAHREPQNGDEITFVLQVEDATDIIYLIKYSQVTKKWGAIAYPTIEAATNDNLGLVKGSTGDLSVNIEKGEIESISTKNEKGVTEDIAEHLNRNSNDIATNTSNISKNAEAIIAEAERAKTAEEVNANAIATETERAQTAEENIQNALNVEVERAKSAEETNAQNIAAEIVRAEGAENTLEASKLDKSSIDENYIKGLSFSLNGDTNVATAQFKNPVSGKETSLELSVLSPASSTTSGVMTAEMVQSLNRALEDIESLKYVGRQIASFPTYAEAELFDWSTVDNIKENDYFIVQVDESRTEPTEKDKTTRYVCVDETKPITLNKSFRFQTVITTVNIQVATESSLGGVLSVNANGYIFVESTGAMKLVGYDALVSSINNLIEQLNGEITRATAAEQANAQAIVAERERAETAEQTLSQSITAEQSRAESAEQTLSTSKADRTELPTNVSELTNDANYATVSQLPTKTSQLTNDSNYATVAQIPTKISQLQDDVGYAKIKIDTGENWEVNNPVLGIGVFGYDSTNKITKIGDGVTEWNDLFMFATKKHIKSFAKSSWTDIANIAAEGTVSEYWKVGDEKTIQLTTGESVTFVILGFDHDNLTSGGKAPISIGMKELLSTTYQMNASSTNLGGWNDCIMRTKTMAMLLSQLPSDLQAVIKPVNKLTSSGNKSGTIITSSDKLWLFSEVEINGTIEAVYSGEGSQYEFWRLIKDGKVSADRLKYLSNGAGSVYGWFLRSPNASRSDSFRMVYNHGIIGADQNNAFAKLGVSFGFCI